MTDDIEHQAQTASVILDDIRVAATFAGNHAGDAMDAGAILRLIAIAADRATDHCGEIETAQMRGQYIHLEKTA